MLDVVEVWVQAADLSIRELGHLTVEEATNRFLSFDWDSENDRMELLLTTGVEDCCPPGMGFVVGDGHILHLMPNRDDALRWLFDRPTSGWFWVDLLRSVTVEARGTMSDGIELIRMLYAQEFVPLWRRSLAARVCR